jgi:hypothetical protein
MTSCYYLTLRKEHSLRAFEKRVLRIIFGLKRDEIMMGWRKLHNEELSDLYNLPTIIMSHNSLSSRLALLIMPRHGPHRKYFS